MMNRSMRLGLTMACWAASLLVLAGKLDKAFQALDAHNYFLAREIFLKEVKKTPSVAWYGLSVITGRDNNPFYQLDSSAIYIGRAEGAYHAASEKQRATWVRYGVNAVTISAQREHVHRMAWDEAKGLNTLPAYERFLTQHPNSLQARDARTLRDHHAFRIARSMNTAVAYGDFLKKYADALQVPEARNRLQEAIFREAAPDGTVQQYEDFVADHPQSPYVREAHERLLSLLAPEGTPEQLIAYIRRYPNGPFVERTWRGIYAQRTRDLSPAAITGFLRDFPDYPYITELTEDFTAASLILYPFRQKGKWGYLDDKGVERIRADLDFAQAFAGGQALVGRGGLVGTINKTGKEVIPISYDEVYEFADGLAVVERNEKAGVMDRAGRQVVPLTHEEIGEFSEGLASFGIDGVYGYIDRTGTTVVKAQYLSAAPFKGGLGVVQVDSGYGAIDMKGIVVLPFAFDWIEGFEGGVSRVRKSGHMGLMNALGDQVLAVDYDHVGPFVNGRALVVQRGKCGYVDRQGRMVIRAQYDLPPGRSLSWGDLHEGVARVMADGKVGLIDEQGERVVPIQYQEATPWTEWGVAVRKKNKWALLNRKGAAITEARYDGAWEFVDGIARVQVGALFGAVDTLGKEVVKPVFTELADMRLGYMVASSATGTGLIDLDGNVRIPLLYASVEMLDRQTALVKRIVAGASEPVMAYVRVADGSFIWKEEGFDRGGAR